MKTLKLKGENHPFALTLLAVNICQVERGISMEELFAGLEKGDFANLFWAGFAEGAKRSGKKFTLTTDDVLVSLSQQEGGLYDAMQIVKHDMSLLTKSLTKKKVVRKK